jgi:hypothetical protein
MEKKNLRRQVMQSEKTHGQIQKDKKEGRSYKKKEMQVQ